mmetsp:Transcript_2478/g.5395  ORF Transcript_2478/g.5395 Transcript_2478/m.5395 type:complete len:486 (+) Transcript_2478:78-1535(+)|eukprot:CAMPEP_0178404132 /NCGR_PEP_ID=MMETSP0689_2-20121128/17723_1 /TAXON_ID=160604 /ORGANISM="Amphidinium massartii, Strain CS-259" /LENGTH=485 /DNA_ID=CAMNT_0020025101 /DNA_START=201 /DNA_END=1658 /DNA_ORIENTATION=+
MAGTDADKVSNAAAAPAEAVEEEEEVVEPEDDAEIPEMLDLIEAAEEAAKSPEELAKVLKNIARRASMNEADRDLLSDFEGIAQICQALSGSAHNWSGEAMIAFCEALPDICRKSNLNRSALRDSGAVDAVIDYARVAVYEAREAEVIASATAINALCTANDANKKAAARLRGDFNEAELVATDCDYRVPIFAEPDRPGALDLLMKALRSFPKSIPVQTAVLRALNCMINDDDPRQPSCVPAAVENRDRAISEKVFPAMRAVAEQALSLEDQGTPLPRLREQAMLLLRSIACREDRIKELIFDAGLLSRVETSLTDKDERVVRACLALIRAFGFSDDIKERLAVESDVALRCLDAVRQHTSSPAICEQGFGLFANLTMRKPHIATRLNGPDFRIIAIAHLVLNKYTSRPSVVRSVVGTIRNVATQDEAAATEVRESGLLDEILTLVKEHEGDSRWMTSLEVARQFLREFRADEGIRKAPQWNDFY